MTDTVTRLMELADEYTDRAEAKGKGHPTYAEARQALQDELTRLFTPLSDDLLLERWKSTPLLDDLAAELDWMDYRKLYLHFAAMHEIGGES